MLSHFFLIKKLRKATLIRDSLLSILALGCSLTISGPTFAQEDSINLDEVSLTDLLDIKIESASKQVEPLSEAPVPMTVITSDMITRSGVRNLKEALILFVPGYANNQDRNEYVFSTRGVYATAQQKVLVMINGQRLNSRSYLTSEPGYGIALHNIDRIEVLRGPGSSIYGNVALSGVINLITKKGKNFDKNSVEIAGGDFGQKRLRMMTGSGGQDWDMLAWGQYYSADGQPVDITSERYTNATGTIHLGGAHNRPAHDFGFTYTKGNWSFFGASRQSSYVEPYGSGYSVYSEDDFRTHLGTGPGLFMAQRHVGAKYEVSSSGWDLSFNPYYDDFEIEATLAKPGGDGQVITWFDHDVGAIAQAAKNYESDFGTGHFLVGAQADIFNLDDSSLMGYSGGEIQTPSGAPNNSDSKNSRLLKLGGEGIYSFFIQDKHKFSKEWIFNGGVRYDYKTRVMADATDNISPRVAMIYLPNDTWEYKLSYSQSFVDAPYWYRYNNGLASYQGSSGLTPELLDAYQFQTVWKSDDKRVRNALTLYYQIGHNLMVGNPDTSATAKYINAGKIESAGLENELQINGTSFQLTWTLQYASAIAATQFQMFDDKFTHVPQLTSTLVYSHLFTKEVNANISLNYIGEQVWNKGSAAAPIADGIDAALLVNLGGRYANIAGSGVYFDARIYNLLDTEYYQGGMTAVTKPYRQEGRWYLASLGAEF